MKYINDCDSLLPIDINLPYFYSSAKKDDNHENFNITQKINEINSAKVHDLIIVGGGLAGISYAARAYQIGLRDTIIIEKNNRLAHNFISRTSNIMQNVMRSSYKHHLGPVEQISLADFARLNYWKLSSGEKKMLENERKGERAIPSLEIFLKHTEHIVHANSILQNTYQGDVTEINYEQNKWSLVVSGMAIRTKRIILATGSILKNDISVKGIDNIENYTSLETPAKTYLRDDVNEICVVGSGNTAAHVVSNALMKGKKVHWVLRSELVHRCADIPNEYWRTEGLSYYHKLSLEERLETLKDIYHGSAMPEHLYLFRKFINRNKLICYEHSEIEQINQDKVIRLNSGVELTSDVLVISFGLKPTPLPTIRPKLRTISGFPVLDDNSLEWANNLYVGSALSALSLGPGSKNVDGMRLAIERIFVDIEKKRGKEIVKPLSRRNQWGTFGPIGMVRRF
ncbi:FAD-dependent oxidoreductase [Sutcliffiella cohnii]